MKRLLLPFIFVILLCSSAGAVTVYVSPTGSGSTCSKASPCGISDIVWADLASETSTLYLFGGTYSAKLTVAGRSTPTGTLSIKPCSASPDPSGCNTEVIIKGSGDAKGTIITLGNNTTLDGETTSGSGTRNIKLDVNGDYNGMSIGGVGVANVVIKYLEITGMAQGAGANTYVLNASGHGSGIEIAHNYFHANDGHTDILAYSQTNDAYGKSKIHDNVMETGTTNYITGGCGGQDIYANTFSGLNAVQVYDIVHCSCGPGDNKPIQYIRFYNNTINPVGSIAALPYQTFFLEQNDAQNIQHIRIYNNVWDFTGETLNNTPVSFFADAGTTVIDDVFIVNNTFVKPSDIYFAVMITGGDYDTALTNFLIENNIFSGPKYAISLSNRIKIANDTATSGVFDYNAISLGASGNWEWINAVHDAVTSYTSVATFATDHATLTHNKAGAPTFVSSSDFRLQAGDTVAKDAGSDLSALSDMPVFNGVNWPYDKNGTSRPQGASWDIGAYEWYETGSIHGVTSMGVSKK